MREAVVTKRKRKIKPVDQKVLKEVKAMNATLNKIVELLDNIWQERRPT